MADWFRWWHGSVTDPKFMWVSRRSGHSLSDVIAVWACLLETASNGETRGNVSCFDSVSHDCLLGFDDGVCDKIIASMTDKGMIDSDGNLTGWERRQPKREDQGSAESRAKSSTERVREYRERMKRQREETNETEMKRNETQKQAREEESREECKPPISPIGEISPPSNETDETSGHELTETSSVPAASQKPTKPDPKGSRLPDDWVLPAAWGRWAMEDAAAQGGRVTADDVRRSAEKFADYWRGKGGKDARKTDWQATWRNWWRRDIDDRKNRTNGSKADERQNTIAALTGDSGGGFTLEGNARLVG